MKEGRGDTSTAAGAGGAAWGEPDTADEGTRITSSTDEAVSEDWSDALER
jgi:hypothetical protein